MPSYAEIEAQCKAVKDDVLAWRRHLHQHPELSFKEFETTKYITHVLTSFACPQLTIRHPTATGVVADLKGGAGDGPIIALRADIDALPLQENTDLPFKSVNAKAMHACGHDTHTAMLLGAAKVLCAQWQSLRGGVRFIFQHAEELLPGGAQELVKAGVMKGVKSVFGIHVDPSYNVGTVAVKAGSMTSCSDSFTIHIRGRGGHASTPHLLVDPVPIAAEVVTALQTVVARKIDPQHAPVVSVTTMTTGPNESHNVIPDEVKLMGTIRTKDRGVRAQVPIEMERIAKGITEAHGATYQFDLLLGYDMIVNDEKLVNDVIDTVDKLHDTDLSVIKMTTGIGASEDFSYYANAVPGCFVILGAGSPDAPGNTKRLHSDTVCIDESCFTNGVTIHVFNAMHHLAQLAE